MGNKKIPLIVRNFFIKLWPIIFIFIVWIIFSSPYFLKNLAPFPSTYLVNFFSPWTSYPELAGPVKNNAMSDVINQIYPWKNFAIEELKGGQIPLWNPYSFSGTPHLANYQSAVLSPFNLLFLILPFIEAWSFLILLAPLLAGLFMYLFTRSINASRTGSLISSISFMFCGFITTWLSYGTLSYAILYLPLSLFAIEKFYKTIKIRYLILLSLTIPLSFFSGHFQISLYFFLTTLGYSIYKFIVQRNISLFILSTFSIFTGILLSLPQILPSVEAYFQSLRSTIFQKGEIIPWSYVPTLIAPDIFGNPVTRNDWFGHYAEWNTYIGIIPLFLALYSIMSTKKVQTFFLFFCGISSLLFAFETPFITNLLVDSRTPVLSTSALSRVVAIFCFSFAGLSAVGFDALADDLKSQKYKKLFIFLGLFVLVFLSLWSVIIFRFFIPLDKIIIARQNFIFPSLIFLSFSAILILSTIFKNKKILFTVLFLITIINAIDLLRFSSKWQPFDPKKLIYPDVSISNELRKISGYDRVFSNLGGEATIFYGLSSLEGYDAVYLKRYGEFISSVTGGYLMSPERSAVNFPKNSPNSFKIMNLLGVKYIVHKIADYQKHWTFPIWKYKEQLSLIYDDGKFQIFENKSSLPRAFIVGLYGVTEDDKEIIETIVNSNFKISEKIVLEKDPEVTQQATVSAKADILEYTSTSVRIRSQSDKDAILFLSDSFYPGWKGYVDGVQDEVLRANYSFRALVVPEGEHLIEFRYQPDSLRYGLYAFGGGIITLVLLGFILRKKYLF